MCEVRPEVGMQAPELCMLGGLVDGPRNGMLALVGSTPALHRGRCYSSLAEA